MNDRSKVATVTLAQIYDDIVSSDESSLSESETSLAFDSSEDDDLALHRRDLKLELDMRIEQVVKRSHEIIEKMQANNESKDVIDAEERRCQNIVDLLLKEHEESFEALEDILVGGPTESTLKLNLEKSIEDTVKKSHDVIKKMCASGAAQHLIHVEELRCKEKVDTLVEEYERRIEGMKENPSAMIGLDVQTQRSIELDLAWVEAEMARVTVEHEEPHLLRTVEDTRTKFKTIEANIESMSAMLKSPPADYNAKQMRKQEKIRDRQWRREQKAKRAADRLKKPQEDTQSSSDSDEIPKNMSLQKQKSVQNRFDQVDKGNDVIKSIIRAKIQLGKIDDGLASEGKNMSSRVHKRLEQLKKVQAVRK